MFKLIIATLILTVAACGGDDVVATTAAETAPATGAPSATSTTAPPDTTVPTTTTAPPDGSADGCAHVIDATIEAVDGGFTIAATVLSSDTGWDKYADAWQVLGPAGEVFGERILAHPHETEQPFTRSLGGVQIPDDIAEVTIAARDLVLGFCGDVVTVAVPRP